MRHGRRFVGARTDVGTAKYMGVGGASSRYRCSHGTPSASAKLLKAGVQKAGVQHSGINEGRDTCVRLRREKLIGLEKVVAAELKRVVHIAVGLTLRGESLRAQLQSSLPDCPGGLEPLFKTPDP